MSRELKTLPQQPYNLLTNPDLFADNIPLEKWFAQANLNSHTTRILDGITPESSTRPLNPLVAELIEQARAADNHEQIESDKWFKWKQPGDRPGDVRVLTPEFFVPPKHMDYPTTSRLFVIPSTESSENAYIRVEKIVRYPDRTDIYGGHHFLWLSDHVVEINFLIPAIDKETGRVTDKFEDPSNEIFAPNRSNAIKSIVAAYVNLCQE